MQIASIQKARTLVLMDIDELNTSGKLRFSELVRPLVSQFDFGLYPTKVEDFDLADKGVVFSSGRMGDVVIDTLKIYEGAMYVETLSSTEDSRKVLLHLFEWGKSNLGLTYREGMVRQWAYVSDIVFYTEFPILQAVSNPLSNLAKSVSSHVTELWGDLEYQVSSISISHDPTVRKNGIANFSIQPRLNIPFKENKYFSEAPLPTQIHINLLEQFEKDVLEGLK